MLFSSFEFIFGFLPVALAGYWLLAERAAARLWFLLAASLLFYSYWDWRFTPLLIGSIAANWAAAEGFFAWHRRFILIAAVTANLICLGIFKYLGFFESVIFDAIDWQAAVTRLALPLGISFFTFHHIIYLVDLMRGRAPRYSFRDYALYIALFPQILAGPLVRHREIVPQFRQSPLRAGWDERLASGIALFLIGLAKKIFLADALAANCDPIYANAATGPISIGDAWTGIFTFPLQIYFDFSGYSDMAIGLALLFGFSLPYNFSVPYRSASLHQLWRRWNMTLSRFLRDYLLVPLAGHRPGPSRHIWALFVTMALAGLWHGAGWTFIIWGALNGAVLCIEVLWRWRLPSPPSFIGWALTMAFWVLASVFFRSPSMHVVETMYSSAVGAAAAGPMSGLNTIAIGAAFALIGPSSQVVAERLKPWRWLAPIGAAVTVAMLLKLNDGPAYEFIYFHF